MSLLNTFANELHSVIERVEIDGSPFESIRDHHYLLIGNGGSAAIAAHICNDLNNHGATAEVPDYSTLTCFANDYGWEKALCIWVEGRMLVRSTLIAISSSGQSKNILNACHKDLKDKTITFSGFKEDNPLRKKGKTNYWVPSHNYGIVECAHLIILHSIVNPGEL